MFKLLTFSIPFPKNLSSGTQNKHHTEPLDKSFHPKLANNQVVHGDG
jgi:hypothetical protein